MTQRIKTVTHNQISWLRWAKGKAKEWRGMYHPDEYEEFDAWIEAVNDAIKAVEEDRRRLRRILETRSIR